MTWNPVINLTGPNGSTTDASSVGPNWYPSKYLSGNYYFCNGAASATTSNPSSATCVVTPWVVCAPIMLASLFAEHTVAAVNSALHIGVWADDGNGRPGTLVLDAGWLSQAGTPGVVELSVSQALTPGLYWVGGIRRPGGSTIRMVQSLGIVPLHQPLGTSLPAVSLATWSWQQVTGSSLPFTDWNYSIATTPSTFAPRIGFKVA